MTLSEILPHAPSTTAEASALFDAAEPVEPTFMIGTWRGDELPTGHPVDGLLAVSGWWGKQFVDAETVHPLLFPTRDGSALWPMNPAVAFAGMGVATKLPGVQSRSFAGAVSLLRPVVRTRSARARLRSTEYRGRVSATMVYDQVPINDIFRKLSDTAVIGAMDLRGSRRPYFFVLRRDESLPVLG